MCGESRFSEPGMRNTLGPSPRVRGIRRWDAGGVHLAGSIPACAGNPGTISTTAHTHGVHPRVCGESVGLRGEPARDRGPSPRVRGILRLPRAGIRARGSIPACAGNPGARTLWRSPRGVHPRVCGESRFTVAATAPAWGPSPRVRGILRPASRATPWPRSIPACAGNPSPLCPRSSGPRVHPRVCGESAGGPMSLGKALGPSPRVRGIRDRFEDQPRVEGSIPACAGNPKLTSWHGLLSRVHPRVCGESLDLHLVVEVVDGPSPRVRGIPRRVVRSNPLSGSIPACAGNPMAGWPIRPCSRVHPRVCGESVVLCRDRQGSRRSIPACAGNPSS